MPTRARAIHAGGSLAGKVSIRLSVMSSIADVLIVRGGRALARPLRLRWSDILVVIDFNLSGCSDHIGVDPLMLPRPKFEREYHQRDTKHQGVGTQPPGEHNGSDQRRDNKEHAIGKRQ